MLQIKRLLNTLPTREVRPHRVIIHGWQGPNEHGREVALEEAADPMERRRRRRMAAKDGN
jgi:hypothetical protein